MNTKIRQKYAQFAVFCPPQRGAVSGQGQELYVQKTPENRGLRPLSLVFVWWYGDEFHEQIRNRNHIEIEEQPVRTQLNSTQLASLPSTQLRLQISPYLNRLPDGVIRVG